jgi:pilus assembly protein CpaE
VTLIVEPDGGLARTLAFAVDETARTVDGLAAAARDIETHPEELLLIVGPGADLGQALELATQWQLDRPHLGVLLLRRRVDVQVLGQALRAGVREVVNPDDLGAVVDAARRCVEISRRRLGGTPSATGEPRAPGRVVTVFSAKGGCGKTTVSTNLAAALAADGGRRVCIVDLDLEFGDVAIALQLSPEHTIVDAAAMRGTLDERGLASLVTLHSPGLDTLLGPLAPGDAARVEAGFVPELVRVLRSLYDVVVIDTPPAFTEHVLACFDLSDVAVLLTTLDVPALKNLRLSLHTLELLGFPDERLHIVLNRADARVGLDLADVEQTLGRRVSVQIPSSGDVPASVNRGELIVRSSPDHAVSRAVRELAALAVPPQEAGTARDGRTSASEPAQARSGLRGMLRRAGAR